jgi:hypothetical protein
MSRRVRGAASLAPLAHARENRDAARKLRDERVDHVVHLMGTGTFGGTFTIRQLAQDWELSAEVVGDYAREASGIVRRLAEGRGDDIKAVILSSVESIRLMALEYGKTDVRGLKVALDAHDLRLRALGLYPKTEIALTVEEEGAALDFSVLDSEEFDTFIKLLAKVKAAKGKTS